MATTAFVNVIADVSRVDGQLTRDLTRIINQVEIRIPPIEIRVHVDTSSLSAAAGAADRTGFSFSGLLKIALKVASGLVALTAGLALSITAIGGLGVAISSAVSALGGMGSILNSIIGVVGVAGAAFAIFKVATMGVGDAFAALSGDSAAFEEALKKLSPAAQSVAREFRRHVGEFKAFQQSLQQALFAQLDGERIAHRFSSALSTIQPAAIGVAKAFGNVGASLVDFITKGSTLNDINTILLAAAPLVERLGNAFISFLGPALDRAAKGAAGLGGTFDVLKGAFDAVKGVAVDVGRIFGAITAAVERAGVSLGGPLATSLRLVANLFESPAGTQFLDTMVELANTLVTTLVPVIKQLLVSLAPVIAAIATQLGPVIKALGPPLQTLIAALGTALIPIINALGPVLVSAAAALGKLVVAIAPLLPIVGQLAAALLPALIPLFDTLGLVFQELAPLLLIIGNSLTTVLAPILAILPQLVQSLVTPSLELAQVAFPLLADIIVALTPAFVQLAEIIATLLPILIPIITATTRFATQLLSFLAPAIRVIVSVVGTVASAFLGFVNGVLNAVVIPAIEAISALFRGDFRTAFQGARTIVTTIGNAIITFFRALPGRALSALSALSPNLGGVATRALSLFSRAVSLGFSNALSVVRSFPGRARSAMLGLAGLLVGSGAALIRGFIRGVQSMGNAAVSAARGIINSVRNIFPFSPAKEGPFSGRGYTTYSGVALMEGFMEGIRKAAPGLERGLSSTLAGISSSAGLTPVLAGAAGTGAGAAATMGRQFGMPTTTVAAPVVNVSIGNKAITEFIDVRVVDKARARERELAQGIRR